MTTGRGGGQAGDGPADTAGGPARHIPVLLEEVLDALAPQPGGSYLDGTFGAGGYTGAILKAADGVRVVALDRDPDAIRDGRPLVEAAAGRLHLIEGRFGDLEDHAAEAGFLPLDGVVLDIGVSSMQVDQGERGFSFRNDGPLDMRMEQAGRSAADIVNEADEGEIADILYHFGEERRSRAIARAILEARRRAPIRTTGELADLVAGIVRAEPNGPHPATRSFQALRIAVNDELGELVRALHAAERVLKPGGRLVVVTFHSLEDRIVKQFMARRSARTAGVSRHLPGEAVDDATFTLATRGPVIASETELRANPRARSAKLRAAERTTAPPRAEDEDVLALAALPEAGRAGKPRSKSGGPGSGRPGSSRGRTRT
ncbi:MULTISPECIES: 16S rRNA (cytosine(1402)-N(4))-methyltransferase RsmH [unclassified Chelatococcus]|uniref:16S rRNA (cytosine(1402)-N(4))-methyltransferase RsmH n=1 Tax=unclassified Chelatococcus TaxID=2638111 RepID=UPI001BCB7C12|nr:MULTISPECIES: 16S rRNA (cytosine(1402)-N(4))-methyltransferase RsmH [unclassified Chelatococcus]CAH1666379.1 16S rRNA m(4)C1402 methyltransferase [Hyphomicrobiales bacterium]MBS7737848.1 16S rRNA (cytosine(1402)-N(4))-methyltransferase RsmH [Chelatococcus sp. HY11]MBX3546704.1 16S rRNA (cytosine(1402)-N(4))-methyltransferase RsmH [Chelatococcus sp.]MCO5079302.1 16S rRNA (cytosine(1402)-N(4))-methyltransferase RsmH [Chelatococcus sp.]CAH1680632.1 16S rRNA m(4)C1402 methyltransferase [Hyphomi